MTKRIHDGRKFSKRIAGYRKNGRWQRGTLTGNGESSDTAWLKASVSNRRRAGQSGRSGGPGKPAPKPRDRPGRRVNVWLPGDLGEQVREKLPGVNISGVLQEALRALLDCEHERLRCADCNTPVDPVEVSGEALSAFWSELLWAWEPLVDRGGTAVGAAQVGKDVAVRMGVPRAESRPLPRPPRSRREPT